MSRVNPWDDPAKRAEIMKGINIAAKRRSKYGAVATVRDGIRFDSMAEERRDFALVMLERGGFISKLERQPKFPLVVNGKKIGTYIADWRYFEKTSPGHIHSVVEDKKGVRTPAFNLKWKLAQALYPAISEWRLS